MKILESAVMLRNIVIIYQDNLFYIMTLTLGTINSKQYLCSIKNNFGIGTFNT